MKKKIIGMMSCMFMAVMFFCLSGNVDAATYGDYVYDILDNGSVMITNYTGDDTEITIPYALEGRAVTRIGDGAFASKDLESVVIPDGVVMIGSGAFSDNGLYSVTIKNKDCIIPDEAGLFGELGYGDLKIKGYNGSTAQAYANKYGKQCDCYFVELYDLEDGTTIERKIVTNMQIVNPSSVVSVSDLNGTEIEYCTWDCGVFEVHFDIFDPDVYIEDATPISAALDTRMHEICGYDEWPDWLREYYDFDITYAHKDFGKNTATVTLHSCLMNKTTKEQFADRYYTVGTFDFEFLPSVECALKYYHKVDLGTNNLGTVSSIKRDYAQRVSAYMTAPEDAYYRIQTGGSKVCLFGVYDCTRECFVQGWDGNYTQYDKTFQLQKGHMYRLYFAEFESPSSDFLITITQLTSEKTENTKENPKADTGTTNLKVNKIGEVITFGRAKYVITSDSTVTLYKTLNTTAKSITLPAAIDIRGITYKVSAISANAFKNCKKLKSVTLGKHVTTIGSKAFSGCKNLKKITIKSSILKKVGSKAFKGISSKAKIIVPKKQLKTYKKLLKGKVPKTAKITK